MDSSTLSKLNGLFARAVGPDEEEARTAAVLMCRLMQKHSLSPAGGAPTTIRASDTSPNGWELRAERSKRGAVEAQLDLIKTMLAAARQKQEAAEIRLFEANAELARLQTENANLQTRLNEASRNLTAKLDQANEAILAAKHYFAHRRCSQCGDLGHNRRTCKKRG